MGPGRSVGGDGAREECRGGGEMGSGRSVGGGGGRWRQGGV